MNERNTTYEDSKAQASMINILTDDQRLNKNDDPKRLRPLTQQYLITHLVNSLIGLGKI